MSLSLKHKKLLDYYVGGFFTVLLKPVVVLLGKLLSRNHDLSVRNNLYFVKMQGGGSLIIALPSLLGLRKKYPDASFVLVTTPAIKPFAEVVNIFDRVIVLDDYSLLNLLRSSVNSASELLKADTIIDLEVYSRLTSILTLCTMARNRIGYFLDSVFWKKNTYTHLIYFNRSSPVYIYYQQLNELLNAEEATVEECRKHLSGLREVSHSRRIGKQKIISIGHACSELSKERMLLPKQWNEFIRTQFENGEGGSLPVRFEFLGGKEDFQSANAIIDDVKGDFPQMEFINNCGKMSLPQSLNCLSHADEFWGVDSSLLHCARLLGIPSTSFWGPTSPEILLRPIEGLKETIHYKKLHCSPCVHIVDQPPCGKNNVCIKKLFRCTRNEVPDNNLFTTTGCHRNE